MKQPKISIIIPVFNREKLVKETLDSVINQTYPNWECIVIDDGSTDNTWGVLLEYTKKDSRIRIYKRQREPKGAPTCRNIGMDLAQGDYFMFLDSDDLLRNRCFEQRISQMPNIDLLLSNSVEFEGSIKNTRNRRNNQNCTDYLDSFLKFQFPFGTPNPTWNKNFIKQNEIKWCENANSLQDIEFHIKCLQKKPIIKQSIYELPDTLIRIDNVTNKISSQKSNNHIVNQCQILNSIEFSLIQKKNKLLFSKYKSNYLLNKIEYYTQKDIRLLLENEVILNTLNAIDKLYLKLYSLTRNNRYLNAIIYRSRTFILLAPRLVIKKEGFLNSKEIEQINQHD